MSHYSDMHYKIREDYDKLYYDMLFKKGYKILDIGCSVGNFIAQDPQNIIGIDIDEDSIKIAKKRGLNAFKHDVTEKMPFNNNFIANVNCRYLLEHMRDPLFLMKDIFRVLKKNGRLILLTDKITRHFWDDYTHQKPFTKRSLEQIAYDAGFRKFKIYDFPSKGVFGLGFLYKHKFVSSEFVHKIYKLFGKLRGHGILIEATK